MAQTIYEFCGIPSMPTIEWDGEAYFKRGIAKVKRIEFQFLVVRLEAPKRRKISARIPISIPCGAIRRAPAAAFQRRNKYFNSLWCD